MSNAVKDKTVRTLSNSNELAYTFLDSSVRSSPLACKFVFLCIYIYMHIVMGGQRCQRWVFRRKGFGANFQHPYAAVWFCSIGCVKSDA